MMDWINLKENGVFVGGHRKSGTTLLMALLDSHSELFVYPYESYFWFAFYPLYDSDKYSFDEKISRVETFIIPKLILILEEWINFKLTEDIYTIFRNYIYKTKGTTKDFFEGVIFSARKVLNSSINQKFWVEKTTSSNIYADKIFYMFPKAKFIQLIRDPRDMYSSLIQGWDEHYSHQYLCKDQLLKSVIDRNTLDFNMALDNQKIFGCNRYKIIKYEDLVSNTEKVMREVLKFIGLEFEEINLKPTVLNKLWKGNAFQKKTFKKVSNSRVNKYKVILSDDEIKVLEYYFGSFMKHFEYTKKFKKCECLDAVRKFYTWFNNNQTYSNKVGRYEK